MTALPTDLLTGPGAVGAYEGPALSFRDVTISFGPHVAVRGVNLDVQARKVTTLVGPSGCGKTTLLRAVNRLHDHAGGRLTARRSVVLPHPDGPTSVVTFCACTSRVTPRTATWGPKLMVTSRKLSAGLSSVPTAPGPVSRSVGKAVISPSS